MTEFASITSAFPQTLGKHNSALPVTTPIYMPYLLFMYSNLSSSNYSCPLNVISILPRLQSKQFKMTFGPKNTPAKAVGALSKPAIKLQCISGAAITNF